MMDGPGGARDPRFNLGYNMGLLGEAPADMYGGAPRALGVARGLKRPGSEPCYEERAPHPLQLEHCAMPDVPDDGYASLQPKKSPPSNGKKTKGRVKIKMEYIDNKLRRYTTFSKRKTGIMKKAYELSTLTGTQVMLLVASETGHVYTFATRKLQPMITSDSGKRLIQTCLNSPDPPTGAPLGDQRMSATGFEETELTYNIADEDIKKLGGIQIDEQLSSAESGDESGSEPESPADRLKRSPAPARRMDSPELGNRSAAGSSSSYEAEPKSGPAMSPLASAAAASGLNAAILCRPNMLGGVGLEGLAPNLALGNLAMGYPHGVIIGLANQGADGSSQSQPQFITIPLSMAMAAAAAAGNNDQASPDLQDLSTGPRK